jgi:hypothetical protein
MIHGTVAGLTKVFAVCGHSLFFHSVLASAFMQPKNVFGRYAEIERTLSPLTRGMFDVFHT